MHKAVTYLLFFAAATSLACCARPTVQPQQSPQPKQETDKSPTGSSAIEPTLSENAPKPSDAYEPKAPPPPAPKRKKRSPLRFRRNPSGGGGGVKPLEADMGDMSTDSAHSHRSLELQMIRNVEASFVRRFRRMALILLSNKRCARHADGNSALAKVSYDSADDIRLSGVEGALASCIKSVFSRIAPSSLAHRNDDSRPVQVRIHFRGE